MPTMKNRWRIAWSQRAFRNKTLFAFLCNIVVLAFYPPFFQHIERRNGIELNDILLEHVHAVNISIPLFIIIWSMSLLTTVRGLQQPEICITFLFSYLIMNILRIITISLVPLNAPPGLIPLIDPLSNEFYGKSFITKDLFFSGHTATQFVIFLCLLKKGDKILTAITTLTVAILVLLQHVHYTMDVIAALPFAYLSFILGRRIAKKGIRF